MFTIFLRLSALPTNMNCFRINRRLWVLARYRRRCVHICSPNQITWHLPCRQDAIRDDVTLMAYYFVTTCKDDMGIRKPRQVIFPAYTSVLLGPVAFPVQGSSGMCDFQLGRTFNRDSSVEVVLSPQNIGSRIFLSKRGFQGASASTRIKHMSFSEWSLCRRIFLRGKYKWGARCSRVNSIESMLMGLLWVIHKLEGWFYTVNVPEPHS